MENPALDKLFLRAAEVINATDPLAEPESQEQLPKTSSSATASDVEAKRREWDNAMKIVARLDPQGKYCKELRKQLADEMDPDHGWTRPARSAARFGITFG
ncbi:MAG: hypothetical protein OEQ18_06595 [Gammaproteobacteria bacterium]|nr:hypothetical protein [Gammaproteobacteria bacterium]MDH5535094.1 hypothetical protein [Betaproteobacteria bacterium]